MTDFIALDLETANGDRSSICAIGIARYARGVEVGTSDLLTNPGCEFDSFNVSIHGITPGMVADKPSLAATLSDVVPSLSEHVVVTHSAFDRVAICKACDQIGIALPPIRWLDSCKLARRCWHDIGSYGLANVCSALQYSESLRATGLHNHLEDARAAGFIVLRAMEDTGLDTTGLLDLLQRARSSHISGRPKHSVKRTGDGDGALVGEVICFTGALTITRQQAADMAAEAGGDVGEGVTKDTTLLVLGDQDLVRLAGKTKSGKHLKAEKLISQGQPLRITGESDFMRLAAITE